MFQIIRGGKHKKPNTNPMAKERGKAEKMKRGRELPEINEKNRKTEIRCKKNQSYL